MKIKAKRNRFCTCGSGKKSEKCCQLKVIPVDSGNNRSDSSNLEKYQKAMHYHRAGDLERAETLYREILEEEKTNPDIYLNLGQIYEKTGRLAEAKACYEKALELKPDYAAAYNNLGIVFGREENMDLARKNYEKALSIDSNIAPAWNNLGLVFQYQKMYRDSEECFKKAISIKPGYADAYNNLGSVYIYQGNKKEARVCFEKAISLDSSHAGAYNNIGNLYRYNEELKEAEFYYLKAVNINPDFPDANNNLGNIYALMGRMSEAISFYKKALISKPDYKDAQSNLLLNLNYSSDHSPEEIFAEHLLFEKRFGEPLKSKIRPHFNDKTPDRKLKIGYVSPDFRTHSVDSFLEPVLLNHDPNLFEIYCYSNTTAWDNMTRQLHSYANYWRIIAGISDEQAAELIRHDQIDILIDLCGHTGHNRMTLFTRKPAPVQVTWLGYPNTTGLSAIDYRITDDFADPIGMTERYHSEQLIRLPECFSCFRPPAETLEVEELPAIKNGYITFGSFNLFAKVTPHVIRVWAEILKGVPGSRLILKNAGLNEEGMKKTLYKIFGGLGIASNRIDLLGKDPSRRDHFQRYNGIDVGLDPFPYNGTTTTCDALWMGVPVITLEGKTHVSRVGVSQMNNLELTELIAETPEEYVEIAKRLSGNLDHLRDLRTGMRARMLASPLMDAKRFTQNLEEAYRKMWKEYLSRDQQNKGNSLKAMEKAQALFKEGKLDDAEKSYQELLLEEPQNIDALHDLGIIAFQNGNIKVSIEFFVKAITIRPDYAVAHNNLGVVCYSLGQLEEAESCYETALKFKPEYAEAYQNLGILFRERGETNKAIGYFQKTLALRPDYPEAQQNLEELKRTALSALPGVETKSHLALQQNLSIDKMRIGFFIQWPKGSLNSRGNVLGDELIADSMCRTLLKMEEVDSCELYAPNHLPDCMLDVMVYMNETPPQRGWAKRHFLYMQNAYNEGSEKALKRFQQIGYDGYAFISNRLLEIQRQSGIPGIFLPFGVDTEQFNPRPKEARYEHDVSYVGNDIKGEERTLKYLYPAVDFNFGLYGTWQFQQRPYQIKFASISRGKIPQEDVPILYSSSKINLNCTAQDCVDWDVITLRTIEVLACKGFLITDRVPIAERELKDCVVFTDGGEDLKKKIAYYLERPKEREKIAQKGYEYVIRNASIISRMKYFLSYLKTPTDFQKTGH